VSIWEINQGLYAIPKGKNVKKALSSQMLQKIAFIFCRQGTLEHNAEIIGYFSTAATDQHKRHGPLEVCEYQGEKITLIRAKTAESVR